MNVGARRAEGDQALSMATDARPLREFFCGGAENPAALPAYVTPETTVAEAMKVMSETHCRHVPVFADGDLVGLISLGDLVRWLTADLEENIRYLEGYILRG